MAAVEVLDLDDFDRKKAMKGARHPESQRVTAIPQRGMMQYTACLGFLAAEMA
jgi:hypothetical protein